MTLMAMPSAAGLFHKVITMSGLNVTAIGPQHAELRMRVLLDHLGLTPERAGELATLPIIRLTSPWPSTTAAGRRRRRGSGPRPWTWREG